MATDAAPYFVDDRAVRVVQLVKVQGDGTHPASSLAGHLRLVPVEVAIVYVFPDMYLVLVHRDPCDSATFDSSLRADPRLV